MRTPPAVKVAALLALAASTDSPPEAAAARRKARELARRHGLTWPLPRSTPEQVACDLAAAKTKLREAAVGFGAELLARAVAWRIFKGRSLS